MPNIFEYDLAAREAAVGAYGSPVHHVQALSPRDFRTSVTPTPTQRTTLIVAGCYVIAIAILWCVSFPCGIWEDGTFMRNWCFRARAWARHLPYLSALSESCPTFSFVVCKGFTGLDRYLQTQSTHSSEWSSCFPRIGPTEVGMEDGRSEVEGSRSAVGAR